MKFKQDQLSQYFPLTPYPLQLQIARTIYSSLDKQSLKLLIIQSPTGTGKTYSLLSPILAWLTHNQLNLTTKEEEQKESVPIWLKKVSEQKGEKLFKEKQKARNEMLTLKTADELINKKKSMHIAKKDESDKQSFKDDQIQIESDFESQHVNCKKTLNKQILQIQKQLKSQDKNTLPKLIFVSRTHSQLAQIMTSLKTILKDRTDLTYLQLASKQQLCINSSINVHKQNINQQCQHLLQHSNCPYFHTLSIKQFYNKNLQELIELGNNHQLCAYYSSRNIIQQADILCLPYASILHREVRQKLGINLNNCIILFDQGHNLLEQEKQMRSPEVTIEELQALSQQIDQYLLKYKQRLKIKNQKLLTHLLEILRAIITACSNYHSTEQTTSKYLKLKYLDFLLTLPLKEIKIHSIIKYFQLNNIDKKLAYFNSNDPLTHKKNQPPTSKISTSTINKILYFLLQFVNFDQHTQILLLKWGQSKKGMLKIMCMQTKQLQNIIEQSRMTIIAGGTMEPLDELIQLSQKWKDKMLIQKYPHIIKPEQCNIYIIKNLQSKEIVFNHHTLNQPNVYQHLQPICTSILQKVIAKTEEGGGIVIFIQNYQLLPLFQRIFQDQPYSQRMIFDSKERNQKQAQNLFSKYKKSVQSDRHNHHILISIMGGKLSQGINFSDRLARSLIVFGLPYSNIYAPEIVETMSYLDSKKNQNYTGKHYYQNMCIKTLNQTIGRGIRHINDYVNIYLVDSRFEGIKTKLSKWMQPNIQIVKDTNQL